MLKKRKNFLLLTTFCFVFLLSFIFLYSNAKKENEVTNNKIKLLWEKYDIKLSNLSSKVDLLNDKNYSDYSLMQLQEFIKRYYNTRNNSDIYTESIYNYKSKIQISKKEIKDLNYSGLYFGNFYSNFYQEINNYRELILNNTDKNFKTINNYFHLYINYYNLKIMNYNKEFSDILENEIILPYYGLFI